MDLSDTLDAIADLATVVVADSRRWRPGFENAAVAVSVEPVSFTRSTLAGDRYSLEAELVLSVGAGDERSQQIRAHEIALELEQTIEADRWTTTASIDSVSVRETRFIRPGPESAAGAALILDVEAIWS